MRRSGAIALLASLFSAACFDLGSPAQPDAVAPSTDGGDLTDGTVLDTGVIDQDATVIDEGTPACVEGLVDPATPGVMISLVSLRAAPSEVHVPAGGVVVWMNTDTRNHRMVSGEPGTPILPENGGFNTGVIGQGSSYAHRFCTVRTLTYYCSNHPGVMNGYRIVIE